MGLIPRWAARHSARRGQHDDERDKQREQRDATIRGDESQRVPVLHAAAPGSGLALRSPSPRLEVPSPRLESCANPPALQRPASKGVASQGRLKAERDAVPDDYRR